MSHFYQPGQTVAAIATPPGEGGVAIIRISGDQAVEIGARLFSGDVHSFVSHTAHFGQVRDLEGNRLDDALLLVFRAPRSYTGEETVEIHCHGGTLISRRVLEVALQAGARAALPGEFTFKAFINGKIDLAQAEAVQELIAAKNEHALEAANRHLEGALSKLISSFQRQLTDTAAILEAWVDFPEEGLEFASMEEICSSLETVLQAMEKLLHTFHDGRIVHDGLSLCLVGSPNVGKSSLMNALLDKDRAIVSPIAGTTRDLVEDHLRLNGLNLKLTDTAGIRDSQEGIEQEGIRRSRQALALADLVLLVLDMTRPLEESEQELLRLVPKQKTIAVWNKSDLPSSPLPSLNLPYQVTVSAKEKRGLEILRQTIDRLIWEQGPPARDELLITNLRHKEALVAAVEACHRLLIGLRTGISPEFLSADMRCCLGELGRIIGTNITEDILSAIFSKFCVGK